MLDERVEVDEGSLSATVFGGILQESVQEEEKREQGQEIKGQEKASYLNNKKRNQKNSRESCCTALYLYSFMSFKCAKMEF